MTDQETFDILSRGTKEWASRQGWSGFRDIQKLSINSLIRDDVDTLVISSGTASGKALPNDTPVLTENGWKTISELNETDRVYASDGTTHRITGIYPQGELEAYKLTLSDHREIECSIDHIWMVYDQSSRTERSATTREIIQSAENSPEARTHIKKTPKIRASRQDAEEEEKLRNMANSPIDYDATPIDMTACASESRERAANRILDMYGEVTERGTVSIVKEKLGDTAAAETASLMRSLGHIVDEHDPTTLTMITKSNPFMDAWRKAKYDNATRRHDSISHMDYDTNLYIESIEPLGKSTQMTCISVDSPDSTFITKDYIVTHNTEAAFLPTLTIIQQKYDDKVDDDKTIDVLYIAPLKALINDQYRRMSEMTAYTGTPTYIWHGDAPAGQKKQLLKEHTGILMTTPESLESFLMNRGDWCKRYLHPDIMIIDEFHSFLENIRGKQLLSLMSRIDMINVNAGKRRAKRIALSATLSQLETVAKILDPEAGETRTCMIIDGSSESNGNTNITVTTYDPITESDGDGKIGVDYKSMAKNIIRQTGTDKTLTFCKSRNDVETMTTTINEHPLSTGTLAYPHHGLLSRQTREDLENRLVNTDKPTAAIATITLELGIDIGDIAKVFQIESAGSVASLRQRLGRSGRRNGQRNIEILIPLSEDESEMQDDLITTIAEVELMRKGWFEPPNAKRKDISVLVSEALSTITQLGGTDADTLYDILCENGAFKNVTPELFTSALDDMITKQYIDMTATGELLIGPTGERETSDWHFYAAFTDTEAYTVKAGKKTIGQITPPEAELSKLTVGKSFKLAGKYWQITQPIDFSSKTVTVKRTSAKAAFLVPIPTGSSDGVHGMIKQKKISLLTGTDKDYTPDYLDDNGKRELALARKYADMHHLNGLGIAMVDEQANETSIARKHRLSIGYNPESIVTCTPPMSTPAINAIIALFNATSDEAYSLQDVPLYRLSELVNDSLEIADSFMGREDEIITDAMLKDLRTREKNNHIFSDETLSQAYGEELIDIQTAKRWMQAFQRFYNNI